MYPNSGTLRLRRILRIYTLSYDDTVYQKCLYFFQDISIRDNQVTRPSNDLEIIDAPPPPSASMWILVTTAVALWAVFPMRATPLDDYVHREDPHYQYSEIGSYRGPEYTMYTLNMTSQKWKTGRFRLFTKCMILKKQEDLNALVNEWMHIHTMSSGNF